MTGKRTTRIVILTLVLATTLTILLWPWHRQPIPFDYVGHTATSNVTTITIGITNITPVAIRYLPGAPQVATNGSFVPPTVPFGSPMLTLTSGHSVRFDVSVTNASASTRVPIFWSFAYDIPTNGVLEVLEDLKQWGYARRYGYQGRGMGTIYTNYVELPAD